MRKENSAIRTKFVSEAGSQLVNADYFAFVELDNYACYCIADGIDNDRTKESAKLAVTTVIDEFYQKPGMGKGLMKHYLEKAHHTLLKESGTFRLEASILVVVTDYKKVRYANAGNARMYHWRNGKIINQSKDQSLSQNMAEQGDISMDKITEHEERHNLYCYAGQRGRFSPSVSKKVKMSDGDIISLMTCGVWENTGIAELLDCIEDAQAPEDVCASMEEIILSQRLRNIQNYTFATIYVDKVYLNPNRQRNRKLVKKIVIPIAIILFMLLIVFAVSEIMFYKKVNSMWNNIDIAITDMVANMDEEGNNNYYKAKEIYEGFDTKGELSNESVIQAKYFLNMLKYKEEYDNAQNGYDRYVAACKVLTCLVGKNGFQRVENDKLDNKVLSVSALHKVDEEYLEELTQKDLENFREEFLAEYESVKVEYQVYMLLEEATKAFEEEIDNASLDKLIKDARENTNNIYGIGAYEYNGTEFIEVYGELEGLIIEAKIKGINLNTTQKEYDDFAKRVESKMYYIRAKAHQDLADELVRNNRLTDALTEYGNAKDAFTRAGESIYNDDIRDLEDIINQINRRVEDDAMNSVNEEVRTLISRAEDEFDRAKYEDAINTFEEIEDLVEENNIASGVLYDSYRNLQERINNLKNGKEYEESARSYEQTGDFSMAISEYERAREAYEKADLIDKEREMRQKINELNAMSEE